MHLPIDSFTICIIVILANLFTWFAYKYDKRASQHGAWRIPENTLHLLALLGGTPAAYFAQRKFRHKTKKTIFQIMFWLIIMTQTALICYLFLNYN